MRLALDADAGSVGQEALLQDLFLFSLHHALGVEGQSMGTGGVHIGSCASEPTHSAVPVKTLYFSDLLTWAIQNLASDLLH